jgi:FkbM family methyltransferase
LQAIKSVAPMSVRKRIRSFCYEAARIQSNVQAIRTWMPNRQLFGIIKVRRIGSEYGGGWVAISLLHSNSLVYSVGIGEEISFDEELYNLVPCCIVGVDPTPRAAEFIEQHPSLPPAYFFVPVGLASISDTKRFYFPADPAYVSMSLVHDSGSGYIDCKFLTLEDLMASLGHDYVDLIKIDIEGEEYALLEDWLSRVFSPPVGQLWVEFHLPKVSTTVQETKSLVQRVKALGLVPLYDGRRGYLFLNLYYHPISLLSRLHFCLGKALVPV